MKPRKPAPVDRLRIERRGGLAGLRASGEVDCATLCEADRAALDALFGRRAPLPRSPGADRYIYTLTRQTARGAKKLEVPEHLLPESLAAAVREKLP
jgi:hypothetical protein